MELLGGRPHTGDVCETPRSQYCQEGEAGAKMMGASVAAAADEQAHLRQYTESECNERPALDAVPRSASQSVGAGD